VTDALRAEHWLHRAGVTSGAQADRIKRALRDAFYIDQDDWKAQVVARTDELVGKALARLAS
jgi:hypothetical protein